MTNTTLPASPRPTRLSGRSAVFLEEMGIGPLWGLRHGAGAAADAEMAAGQTPAAAGVEAAPSVRAPVTARAEPANPAPLSATPAHAAAVTSAAVAPVANATATATATTLPASAAAQPRRVVDVDAVAPPVHAASADSVRATPAPIPAPALDDDSSTAWFDDAPAAAPAAPVSDEAIAAMDWNALRVAAAKCTRCALCRGRKSAVFGRGDTQAEWLVLGGAPLRADEKNMQAFSGDAGRLLDNMLQAVGVSTTKQAYVTNLVKCRAIDGAGLDRAPTPDEAAACRPFLERELVLTGAGTVLAFGQATVKGLLGDTAPARRGTVHRLGQVNVVASFHPEDLLRQGDNKGKAWADLCLAKAAHAGRG